MAKKSGPKTTCCTKVYGNKCICAGYTGDNLAGDRACNSVADNSAGDNSADYGRECYHPVWNVRPPYQDDEHYGDHQVGVRDEALWANAYHGLYHVCVQRVADWGVFVGVVFVGEEPAGAV